MTIAKHGITIAIELVGEEKIAVNIHAMVEGKVKETYLADVNVKNCDGSFPDIWKQIGENIHKHMKDNPDYYDFGS